MAINLSAQRIMTRNSVAEANKFNGIRYPIEMAVCVLLVSVFTRDSIIRRATYEGYTTKPTSRSETAKLRSNVFKVFDKDGVFLMAWIVTIFSMVAV